jgi:spermidine/putrescine-binding protein
MLIKKVQPNQLQKEENLKMCHKLKFLFSIPLATITLISPFALSSCGNQGIVFANFESYMSPQLMKELHRQHQINFVNYSTNEDILAKFANSYDIAVPSTYSILELIKKGLLGGVKDGTNELGID